MNRVRDRVVRATDIVVGALFWAAVVVVLYYSAYSKRMCSKRNWFASACGVAPLLPPVPPLLPGM